MVLLKHGQPDERGLVPRFCVNFFLLVALCSRVYQNAASLDFGSMRLSRTLAHITSGVFLVSALSKM